MRIVLLKETLLPIMTGFSLRQAPNKLMEFNELEPQSLDLNIVLMGKCPPAQTTGLKSALGTYFVS